MSIPIRKIEIIVLVLNSAAGTGLANNMDNKQNAEQK